jgi:hypothetical protein
MLTNLLIDPRGLYGYSLNQFSNSSYSDRLGDRLNSGSNAQTINELAYDARRFKYNKIFFERRKEFDCIVFGSSHVNQFSSLPPIKALDYSCNSILNLSFPGTSIEDYLASSYLLLQNKLPDQKLFFSVATSLFSANGAINMLWLKNFQWVLEMNNQLSNKILIQDPYISLGKNLFNAAYFKNSLTRLFSSVEDSYQIYSPKFIQGHDHTVMLRDGSIIYSQQYVAKKARTPVLPMPEITFNSTTSIESESSKSAKMGLLHVDQNGLLYSTNLFATFTEMLLMLRQSGYDVNILLTPIHPAIYFDSPKAVLTKSLKQVEAKLISLSSSEGIPLHGSYNPQNVGCNANEYYDTTHIMYSCISKIKLIDTIF